MPDAEGQGALEESVPCGPLGDIIGTRSHHLMTPIPAISALGHYAPVFEA